MKISTLLLLIMLAAGYCCTLHAQHHADVSFKRFGFHAGVSISNMNFNKGIAAPPVPVAAAWKAGIQLGMLLRVPLGKSWILAPEYNYTQQNGADNNIGASYKMSYFSMPVLLHYKINHLFSLCAGPQGALLLHATENNNSVTTNITHDTEERSFAAVAGVTCRFADLFFISARYLHGLNHIGIGQRSAVKEFKYEAVNITAGIYF